MRPLSMVRTRSTASLTSPTTSRAGVPPAPGWSIWSEMVSCRARRCAIRREVAANLVDIGTPQHRARRVVGTDRLPGVTEPVDVAGENPGADMDVGAGLEQVAFSDSVSGQRGKPARVDLHQPDIARTVAVAADCLRVQAGLGSCDGLKEGTVYLIARCGIVPAGVCREARAEREP